MQIILNGDKTIINNNMTIAQLLQQFELDSRKVAVELNKNLVFHHNFDCTLISQNDIIEIVHFIGGG
jgi:sulfur carrier protein